MKATRLEEEEEEASEMEKETASMPKVESKRPPLQPQRLPQTAPMTSQANGPKKHSPSPVKTHMNLLGDDELQVQTEIPKPTNINKPEPDFDLLL